MGDTARDRRSRHGQPEARGSWSRRPAEQVRRQHDGDDRQCRVHGQSRADGPCDDALQHRCILHWNLVHLPSMSPSGVEYASGGSESPYDAVTLR